MNVRLTVILIVALAVVGGVVYFAQANKTHSPADTRPLFYKVEMSEIATIRIENQGKSVRFVQQNGQWVFDDADHTPVDTQQFGGTTLLLSGPRAERLVYKQIDDLAKYGLDNPVSRVEVTTRSGQRFVLKFGKYNVNGSEQYTMLEGSPGLYMVLTTWTQAVTRFADKPPYIPTPEPLPGEETPTPEASGTPEATGTPEGTGTPVPAASPQASGTPAG